MISPQTVKDLREKTGAGMADCKKALEEANGNIDEAIEWLRKRGAASIAKRADRDANEGIVVAKASADGNTAAIVEVNCETDFVGRNDEFVQFANVICDTLLSNDVKSEEELWNLTIDGGKTLGNYRDEILSKFSEKIGLRRWERINTNGVIADYVHAGNRLAVLVEFEGAKPSDEAQPLMRDVAMQVAAMQPMFVSRDAVDTASIDKEIEIYKQQAMQEGKNEDLATRIATGKLEKFYQEQVLTEQTFVKDPSRTVKDIVKEISKHSGNDVKVLSFRRYYLGEK